MQELGKLYSQSGKFKHLYLNLPFDDPIFASPTGLTPICPTRWLTRANDVRAVIQNFGSILDALEKASAEFGSNTGCRASGIRGNLATGKVLLGLHASLPLLQCMEGFNRALQAPAQTVVGMLQLGESVKEQIQHLRSS